MVTKAIAVRLAWLPLAAALMLASPVSAQADASAAAAPQEAQSTPLFAILYQRGPNWTPGVPLVEQGLVEHYYYMRDLHRSGKIVLAGPLGEDGGLVILRAADQTEADRVISVDPAVTTGKFVGVAKPYSPAFSETK